MLGILRGIAQEFGTSSLQWLFPLALGIFKVEGQMNFGRNQPSIYHSNVSYFYVFLPYILPLNPPVPHISFFPARTKAQKPVAGVFFVNMIMICEKVVCVTVVHENVVCDTGVCYNVVCDNVACVCAWVRQCCVCDTVMCGFV